MRAVNFIEGFAVTTSTELTYRVLICAGAAGLLASAATAQEGGPPESVKITGVVRDFKAMDQSGGHPDFENNPENGMGRYAGNMAVLIGDDGKPIFKGGGAKITN